MWSLRFVHGCNSDTLADMFRLSKSRVDRILKDTAVVQVDDTDTVAKLLQQALRDVQVFSLVKEIVESKRGLITIALLQKLIRARLGAEIKRHHLLKVVKIDLGLKWGAVRS